MTQHVSPLTSLSCCQCTCGGAQSPTQDSNFGTLLDALTTTPFSSNSRSGSGGIGSGAMGVGDWFGFMDPMATFQLKQMLADLRASQELERGLKARIQEARAKDDPSKGAPNRFADVGRPDGARTRPARPARTASAPAAKATPAAPATSATPATPAAPATPASRAARPPVGVPATPAGPAMPRAVPATPATPATPAAPAVRTTPASPATPATPAVPATSAPPAAPAPPRDVQPRRVDEIKQHGHEPRQRIRPGATPAAASAPDPVAPRTAGASATEAADHDHSGCHASA